MATKNISDELWTEKKSTKTYDLDVFYWENTNKKLSY